MFIKSYFILILLYLGSITDSNFDKLYQIESIKEESEENFNTFLARFFVDDNFKHERIKYPLEVRLYDYTISTELIEKEYNYTDIKKVALLNINFEYLYIIADSHSFKLNEDSDERLLRIIKLETGVNLSYYFQRENGLWFLIRIEDFST